VARAAAGGLEQTFQVGPRALRDKFDRTVVSIPNPAAQLKLASLPRQEVAETNPLDVTADDAL
jgi:hypothetical protein